MILIILPLILTLFLFWIGCLIYRRYKPLLVLTIPIVVLIGMYVWCYTLLPIQLGLKKTPKIALLQVREMSENERFDSRCDSAIEFISDKELDAYIVILVGSPIRNLSYNDFMNNDSLTILDSYDVTLVKKVNDKYLYKALFTIKQPDDKKISGNIYCKLFLVQMLAPVYETNEIIIPLTTNYYNFKNSVYNDAG